MFFLEGSWKTGIDFGIVDKYQYFDIISENIQAYFKHAQGYFEQCQFPLLPWPAQSPNLNPLEHLWAYVGIKLVGYRSSNKHLLFDGIEVIWCSITLEYSAKLILSMEKRCVKMIKTKGGHTKY